MANDATSLKDRLEERRAQLVARRAGLSVDKQAELAQFVSERIEEGETTVIRPRPEEGPLSLSFAQQRLWFLDQMEPGSTVYNMPAVSRLNGKLQVAALAQSLNEIIRRHESLRTGFPGMDGNPVQIILPGFFLDLPLVDLQGLPKAERETEERRLALEQSQRPFNLADGPLLRAVLLRLGEHEHTLILVIHHIVSDGWSFQIIIQELESFYKDYSAGGPPSLPDLPIQYADYANWQRSRLEGPMLRSMLAYWKEQLKDAPVLLELPFDRPRPSVMTFKGALQQVLVPQDLTEQLRALSQREGLTLFMTLLTSFQMLLSRFAGQEDIVVGTPVAGRPSSETEVVIGLFVNTVVLRTNLSGNPTIRELLDRVREVVLDAQANQELPFEKLVEELQPERTLSYNPLFQVMLVLENIPKTALHVDDLTFNPLSLDPGIEKFDLTLSLAEGQHKLSGCISYSTDLFDQATVEHMMESWQRVLETMVAEPELRVTQLSLLSEAARRQVTHDWNQTAVQYPATHVHERIEMQAHNTPTAVAVTHAGRQVTFFELNQRANKLAHYLKKLEVGPEVRVAICLERSLEMVTGLLGILKAGGAYVPLDSMYPTERLQFMLQDAQVSVLLTQRQFKQHFVNTQAHVICLEEHWDEIARESSKDTGVKVQDNNLAYVIYTSGSTGKPKGVSILHRGAAMLLNWAHDLYPAEDLAGVLASTSICFDLSVFEIFVPLSRGGTVVVVRNVIDLLELPPTTKITLINTVPSAMAELVRAKGIPASVRTVNLAGEALHRNLVSQIYECENVKRVFNLYGPSEATTYSTCVLLDKGDGSPNVPIGRPIANTQTYVTDENCQPVPAGVVGELYIGGAGLARGYLDQPAMTAQQFVPNPFSDEPGDRLYRTGDRVRWRRNGDLEFLGRLDQQVKVRGYRIELEEIENALLGHPHVEQAVAVARQNGQRDKQLAAYVVVQSGQRLTNSELQQHLRKRLPEYMVPEFYVRLNELPLTPNGKVDRGRLPEPTHDPAESGQRVVPPQTLIEEVVAGIWSHVLDVAKVDRADNFFRLGGHSLLATRVISRVRESFQIEMSLRSLFESPTLAEFAERVEAAMRAGNAASAPAIRPIARQETLPLSYAQQRLWFLDQMSPNSSTYNISTAVQLDAELNVVAVEQCLNEIVRRHEALRTTFMSVGGDPKQIIGKVGPVCLPIVDLSGLKEDERAAELARLSREHASKPFALSKGPLLRVCLLRLGKQGYVELVSMHHIISDAWSTGVLMQESEAIFNAFSSGRPSPLEELEIQYADYAQWQREWLQGEVLASELHYWRKQLAGAPTVLDLPTDHPRPTARTQPGKHCRLTLPANLSKRLREFAREEGVTVFMTLMAAFQALLTRYTGQDDILVGTPIAGRGRLALEDLIGFFVNMVVLRADLHAAPTFRGLVRQVRESALGAYAHQDLPFDKLVEGLRPERGVGRNPLFQVVLAFQNAPAPALAVSGATLPSAGLGSADAKFDLELYLWNAADELSGSFFYSPELFENATVTRMVAHFESLLEQVVVRADASLSDFCFMTQAEVHQIIEEWNDTDIECPAETCVHHFVETQTRETPMAIALEWEDRQMTYRELDQRANQLAHYLRKLGIGPEVPVGICLERGLNMVVGLLAILKAGGAYVPMDLDYPAERLAYVLRDASVGVLLTQERLIEKFPQQERKVSLDKDWELIAKESDEPVDSKVVPGNLAYIIYTSGSTGHPKGVMVRHSSLSNLIAWHNRTYGVTCADRATQLAGIAFDAATWEIWPYLTAGARLLLPRAQGIEALSNWLAEQKVSICFLATPLAEAVIRDLPLETPLRYLLTGGDALHRIDKQFGFKFVNHYGPTESTVLATCAMVDCSLPGDPPIGRPIANTRIYILDKHLRSVPIGVTGEIYIGGAGVARGYWKRPSLTAERFLPDPFSVRPGACLYRTGDAGCYLPDGTVEFKGRIDHQIKIRGFRVELGEIESVLSLHPKVKEAVVVVREATPGSKRLVAYVIPKEEPALASDELKQYLKERLPEYMVPSVYVTLESLPLTPNGKVDRPALPEPDHRLYRSEKAYIPPQDQLQEQLAKMWEELLGTGPIGAKDDFFELGGHSLLAVQLISRIEERFGKRVPMTALFEEATIERLSHFLREETGTQDSSLLVPIQPNGTNPPLYFVHAAGGHVLFYAPLARYLNQEQPFYGMQARDSGKDAPPHSQLEAMAAEYVAVIRGFQPVGPYMVGGWSMGGVIAFEMARQLVDQKHKVAVLALIDSKAPSKKAAEYRSLELLAGFARDLGMRLENLRSVWEELVRLPPMAQLNRVWSQAKSAKLIPPDMTLADFRKLFDSFKTKAHMLHSYAGGSYSGRISLFRAEQAVEPIVDKPENLAVDPDPTRGWAQFAAEGVEIYPIPGQHFTMLQEPNVKTLAEQLHICIHNAAKEAK